MSGELITQSGQWQIRDLLMGTGTDYRVRRPGSTPHAWPEVRSEDIPYDAADGVLAASDLLGARRVPLLISINATSRAAARSALQSLQAAWKPASADVDLAWRDDLGTFRYVGRPRLADPNEDQIAAGFVTVECRFLATSPYYETLTADTAATTRTTPGAGFSVPFTPPFTLPSSTSGTVRCTNAGTADAPWTGRLDGPLTDPVIENRTTGQRLAFTANGGLDLAAGEYVLLDSRDRSVLLAGSASRRTQLSLDSRWWSLLVGDNDIELTADTGSGSLTVSWRSAWM